MFRYSHLKSELPYSFNSIPGGDGIDIRSLLILGYMIAQSIENVKLQKMNLKKETNHNGHLNKVKILTETTSQTQKLSSLIQNFSKFDIPILITGEVGTEKELIARTLHYQSSRGSYPFICVNCSSFSESLLQKDLFGSENGASPNLVGFHKGKLELANKGTIFLDEVTKISLKTQKKLLRFLEKRKIERIGSCKSIPLDVKLIAASNDDLKAAVASGLFLRELYYHLNYIKVDVSPLRTRKTDIPLFVKYYLEEIGTTLGKVPKRISQSALDLLMTYDWPGNVRELRKVIERSVILGKEDILYPHDFPEYIQEDYIQEKKPFPTLEEMKKKHIVEALKIARGNISKAASLLDIGRATVYANLKLSSQNPCLKEE